MKKLRIFTKEDWVSSFLNFSRDSLRFGEDAISKGANSVGYKLICDSIEFSLKGFFLCPDYNLSEIKNKFNHDLYSLASFLNTDWLVVNDKNIISSDDLKIIKKVSDAHEGRILHYPNEYEKNVPNARYLKETANNLMKNLKSEYQAKFKDK